jgi:hypothetical protein
MHGCDLEPKAAVMQGRPAPLGREPQGETPVYVIEFDEDGHKTRLVADEVIRAASIARVCGRSLRVAYPASGGAARGKAARFKQMRSIASSAVTCVMVGWGVSYPAVRMVHAGASAAQPCNGQCRGPAPPHARPCARATRTLWACMPRAGTAPGAPHRVQTPVASHAVPPFGPPS